MKTEHALRRVSVEARAGATLLRAGAPLALGVPPHRYLAGAAGLRRHGPLGGAVALLAAMHRDRTAVVDDRGELSFADLGRRTSLLADAFRDAGVGPGTGVGILCRNHRGFVEALIGAGMTGATLILLNTDFSGPQLADVCRREGVDLLIHDEEFTPRLQTTTGSLRLGAVVAWTEAVPSGDTRSLESLISSSPPRSPRVATSPRLVLLTSGTTGTPKGAPRGVGDAPVSLAPLAGLLGAIPYKPRTTFYVAPPLFHAWGLVNLAIALGLGSTVAMSRSAEPSHVWRTLVAQDVDTLVTVPTLISRLLRHLEQEEGDQPSAASPLRVVASSGSALPGPVAVDVERRWGSVLHNLYGSTEAGYVAIAGPSDLRERPGTVGRPPLGVRLQLLDSQGVPVRAGTVGRIFADTGIGFSGYTGGGTKEAVDGMLMTGDVGRVDSDGYLFVEGRDDDMIVSGGENVFPAEVDDCLMAHPAVLDAVTVGVDDTDFGQRLRAYVVPADPKTFSEEILKAHVREHLARFKVPRDVVPLPEIPRNPAGKVMKQYLPDAESPRRPREETDR